MAKRRAFNLFLEEFREVVDLTLSEEIREFGSIVGKTKAKLLCEFVNRCNKLGNVKQNTF